MATLKHDRRVGFENRVSFLQSLLHIMKVSTVEQKIYVSIEYGFRFCQLSPTLIFTASLTFNGKQDVMQSRTIRAASFTR